MWRRGGSGWALGAEASAYSNEGVESPSPLVGLLTAKQRQFYMKDERLRIMRLLNKAGLTVTELLEAVAQETWGAGARYPWVSLQFSFLVFPDGCVVCCSVVWGGRGKNQFI